MVVDLYNNRYQEKQEAGSRKQEENHTKEILKEREVEKYLCKQLWDLLHVAEHTHTHGKAKRGRGERQRLIQVGDAGARVQLRK